MKCANSGRRKRTMPRTRGKENKKKRQGLYGGEANKGKWGGVDNRIGGKALNYATDRVGGRGEGDSKKKRTAGNRKKKKSS